MSRFRKTAWISATALALAGCDRSSLADGGSGTEAGNALTVVARSTTGAPVRGAGVEIWPWSQVPCAGGTAPSYRGATDSLGEASIAVSAGDWSVLVRKDSTAFRVRGAQGALLVDSLRRASTLTGIVRGGGGALVSLTGLGKAAACDSTGLFKLDSLPSGALSLVVGGSTATETTQVSVDPGASTMVLAVSKSIPSHLVDVPADTLISFGTASPPIHLLDGVLDGFGAFSAAIRLWRNGTTGPATVLSWTDDRSAGIRLGWIGGDTMVLAVDGVQHVYPGIPLGGGRRLVGLAWTGSRIEVYVDGSLSASVSTDAPLTRARWNAPVVAQGGIDLVDWIAIRRSPTAAAWFSTLSGM